jgi:2-hydroxychromene-2-carboxylate isomerase
VARTEIKTPATVARCLASSGEDANAILEQAQSRESKARLRAQTETALRAGIFGAPSFLVGDELFWGNDRLEDALSWATCYAIR